MVVRLGFPSFPLPDPGAQYANKSLHVVYSVQFGGWTTCAELSPCDLSLAVLTNSSSLLIDGKERRRSE